MNKEIYTGNLPKRKLTAHEIDKIEEYFKNRTILVTGGAGCIGSEICVQVLGYCCKQLVVFDINENALSELGDRLAQLFPDANFITAVGSVRDNLRLAEIFEKYNIDMVIHTASYKNAALMENNPQEAIKNNILGTYNVAINAASNNVKKFILISTDKEADCKNILDASKRISEMIVQSMNINPRHIKFSTVRLGGFDSEQLSEAVLLILKASFLAEGGEVFILNMGKPDSTEILQSTVPKAGFIEKLSYLEKIANNVSGMNTDYKKVLMKIINDYSI